VAWHVKFRQADGSVADMLCDEACRAATLYDEQKAAGREVWITDERGRMMSRGNFDP
jgi:hypothetical protein